VRLAKELTPTPICDDDTTATPPQIEGPFYIPNSPQRNSLLEPAILGTKILLSGQVLYSIGRHEGKEEVS
jgi:protocatechuate 3,4-dioxygenase beta subunit